MDVIFKAPKSMYVTEEAWMKLVEEWKRTGKMIRPMEVKRLCPECFAEFNETAEK